MDQDRNRHGALTEHHDHVKEAAAATQKETQNVQGATLPAIQSLRGLQDDDVLGLVLQAETLNVQKATLAATLPAALPAAILPVALPQGSVDVFFGTSPTPWRQFENLSEMIRFRTVCLALLEGTRKNNQE